MKTGNSKKIKVETIGEKAKKKKDFLITAVVVGIFTFLAISIGLQFMSVDKERVFKERTDKLLNKKEVTLIPVQDFKENWAISMENTLEKQNNALVDFMEHTTDELNNTKNDLKDMIIDSIADQKDMLEKTATHNDQKLLDIQSYLEDKLEKQENRIEEISIMKDGGNINISSQDPDKNFVLGKDLLPPLPGIDKTNGVDRGSEETLEDIIGGNNIKHGNTIVTDENGTKVFTSNGESKNPVVKRTRVSLFNIDTEGNKAMIMEEEKAMLRMEATNGSGGTYHIMLGLARAYMITGAYAPTFTNAEEEPLPVLLQAEGDIIIANDDSQSVDRCLLIGSAKGNMNSRTADIRLVKISCSLNEGKQMIEGKISGWVIGENGIPGIGGELLHKNGAWLAQTFVAGFMQTFSDALANSGTTQISYGGNNGNQQVPFGDAVTDNAAAAAGGGLSTVFGQLGDYYLKMAEQIFPVIEVKGGRTVNIILKGGEDFDVKDFHKLDIGAIEETYSEKELKKLEETEEIDYNKKSTPSIFETK